MTPLMKILLLGVEYSLAISRYSFRVTLAGMEGKLSNSQMAIFRMIESISAIRSLSQLGVLPSISFSHWASLSRAFTSELQSRENLVCRLLLEKKKTPQPTSIDRMRH